MAYFGTIIHYLLEHITIIGNEYRNQKGNIMNNFNDDHVYESYDRMIQNSLVDIYYYRRYLLDLKKSTKKKLRKVVKELEVMRKKDE